MRDRRDDVIRAHWELAVRASGESTESLAARAVELYESRTPLHARRLSFQPLRGDLYTALRANALHVRRFLGLSEPATRMPVELEEALVLALPEPFRGECQRELADRVGLLAAKVPEPSGDPTLPAAELMRETARVITALAPALRDGRITAEDMPAVIDALGALADVSGAVASLRTQLCQLQAALSPVAVPRLRVAEVDPS
jgi:hypothetical protein